VKTSIDAGRSRPGIAVIGLPALILSSLLFVACATVAPATAVAPRLSEPWAQVSGVNLVRQQSRSDCGSAALAMVLSHFDPSIDAASVRRQLGSGDEKNAGKLADQDADKDKEPGIAAGRLRDVARARGLRAYVIEASLTDLANEIGKGHPVLVGLYRIVGQRAFPHYEVVAGLNRRDQQVLTVDPAEGWRQESVKDFAMRWHLARNLAIVIFPDQSRNPPVARNDDHR
jgi:ABC-type bacteriocin/lantibiotic exporter with double-glycine peptidase domain